jgi:hypothetical protein
MCVCVCVCVCVRVGVWTYMRKTAVFSVQWGTRVSGGKTWIPKRDVSTIFKDVLRK